MKAKYQIAADVFDDWREDVLTGEPPILYPIGSGDLARIEVGPKLVTLIGGSPGVGKTAFTMQCIIDALRINPLLRVLVCNIEMTAEVLLDRQLARLSGVDAHDIRYRKLNGFHAERLDQGMSTLEHIADRLCFVRPPYDLANVAASADAFNAKLILLDYIQRIPPPGKHGDRRGSIDATMNYLRRFADAGVAVIVVAAVARQKDAKGRASYEELTLASFRESSELEFGADDAFILVPLPKINGVVKLRHLKARHTEPIDLLLKFNRQWQSFEPIDEAEEDEIENKRSKSDGKLKAELAALWDRTEPAGEDWK